jgi:hypothetical protein
MYYIFYLEMSLKNIKDSKIYAFVNVSHIETSKLIEIFEINIDKDPYLDEGYFLSQSQFTRYKDFLNQEVGSFNFKIFEYCLRLYSTSKEDEIKKMYKDELAVFNR